MDIQLLDFLILSLATLYLAFALTKTHGPFKLFETIRLKLPLGGLTTCLTCAAPWTAGLCYLAWLSPLQPIIYVLAAAGLATFAAHYSGMAQQ